MSVPTARLAGDPFADTYRHFQALLREDGIVVAGFDCAGKSVNVLNAETLTEWKSIVRDVLETPAVTALVLVSLKRASFCAGADLELVHDAQRRHAFDEIAQLVTMVHQLFETMTASRKPFVAAVEGACLGGGLELALACHARLGSAHPGTSFGLPEVKLGMLPGFGGTQRLPRMIGLPAALELMTTGKTVAARQAVRLGLIDELVRSVPSEARDVVDVQQEALVQAAIDKAHGLAQTQPRRRTLRLGRRIWSAPMVRSVLCRYVRRRVRRHVRDFYPAPLRVIEAVERGMRLPVPQGALTVEKPLLLELLAGSISRHLVTLFLTGERLKHRMPIAPSPVDRIGVLGAGTMGRQIAEQMAEKGGTVIMRDVFPDVLARAMGTIHANQVARKRKGTIRAPEVRDRELRIIPTVRAEDVGTAPLVIEAVSETLEVKRAVLAELEAAARAEVTFATNTSSCTLADIAAHARHPERCVGLHFFNPVAKMPLVEVIRAPFTAETALALAYGVVKRLGKFPLQVNDGPGFLVNRVLCRYLAEAVILVSEGVSFRRIDQVATRFGMAADSGHPMGPLELLDLIGLPVALDVLSSLSRLGPRMESREALLRSLISADGTPVPFWKSGKENPSAVQAVTRYRQQNASAEGSPSDDVIHKRLFLPMVDEAARCLHDKIVEEPWQVDFGMTCGIGFPAFRGGLLTWARQTMSPEQILDELQALVLRFGKRFQPADHLTTYLKEE